MPICIRCDQTFKVIPFREKLAKFCSYKCRVAKITIVCKGCSKEFSVKHSLSAKKFCSKKCTETRKLISCEICGKERYADKRALDHGHGRFCSKSCARKSEFGESHAQWRGGRYYSGHGYVLRNVNRSVIFEHRYFVEQFLERPLTIDETIHHINEIKDDNRLENLYLFETSGAHSQYHWDVKHGLRDLIVESNLHDIKACDLRG